MSSGTYRIIKLNSSTKMWHDDNEIKDILNKIIIDYLEAFKSICSSLGSLITCTMIH